MKSLFIIILTAVICFDFDVWASSKSENQVLEITTTSKHGIDYKSRPFEEVKWSIQNISNKSIYLPIPISRSDGRMTGKRFYKFRVLLEGKWSRNSLEKHEINYQPDWKLVSPGESYPMFSVSFYEDNKMWSSVEASVSIKDDEGFVSQHEIKWILKANQSLHTNGESAGASSP